MGARQSSLPMTWKEFQSLVFSTNYSSDEILEWARTFERDYPTGKISKKEFRAVYESLYPEGDSKNLCDYIFNTYDLDGDGTVNFREFLTTINVTKNGTPIDKLQWTFRLYDLNGDGFISEKELVSMLMAIYKARNVPDVKQRAKEKARELIEDIDLDGDGKLSAKEFVTQAIRCPSIRQLLQGSVAS